MLKRSSVVCSSSYRVCHVKVIKAPGSVFQNNPGGSSSSGPLATGTADLGTAEGPCRPPWLTQRLLPGNTVVLEVWARPWALLFAGDLPPAQPASPQHSAQGPHLPEVRHPMPRGLRDVRSTPVPHTPRLPITQRPTPDPAPPPAPEERCCNRLGRETWRPRSLRGARTIGGTWRGLSPAH